MPQQPSTHQTLRAENAELRARLADAEEMLRAIRGGEVDLLVVEGDAGPRFITLQEGRDAEQLRGRGEMIAQVSDAVVAVDLEQRITFLNAAAERLYGVQSGEMLGRKLTGIFARHWPSPEEEATAWTALREHGEWHGQYLQRTHQGREVHVDSSFTALRDAHGEIIGYLSVIRDITERHQAEAALHQNSALFFKIIEQAPGGVYVVDAQFRLAQVNAEALPAFASVQPLIGRDFDEVMEILWGPEIGPQCASIFRHTLAKGERYISPRFSEQRHDLGVEQAFEWETQRITLPDGQHGVVCYFQDVTARELAEAARRESEERLSLAVKCSQVVLFQQDLELRYTWHRNPELGLKVSDFIGKRDADLMERAEDAAVTEALKREVIRSGVSQRQEVLVHIQGVDRQYDLLVEPLRNAAAHISGVTCAAIDITERKQTEEALREKGHFLQRIADVTPGVLHVFDLGERHSVFMNSSVTSLIGYSPEEVLAMGAEVIPSLMHAEDLPRFDEHLARVCALPDGEVAQFEFRMRDRAGAWHWFLGHDAVFTRDAAGAARQLIGVASEITERKRAEQALGDRTELLNGVLEGTTDVIFVKDLNGRMLLANAAFAAAAGSTPEQLVGKTDEDWFPPDVAAGVRQQDEAVIAGGAPMQFEETIPVAGEARFFLTLKAPLRDGSSRVVGILGIGRDITERKRAEAALRASEQFNQSVLNSIPAHVAVLDADGTVLAVNAPWRTFAEDNGLGSERCGPGTNYVEVCRAAAARGDADAAAVAQGVEAVLHRRQAAFRFEYACHSPDEQRWFVMEAQRALEPLTGAIVSHWSITERKQAEEALRESEEQFKAMANTAPAMIWVTNPDATLKFISRGWQDYTGQSETEAFGKEGLGWLDAVHPEDAGRAGQVFMDANARHEPFSLDYRIRRFDGEYCWAIDSGRPHFDNDGHFLGYVGSVTDVHERKQAEAALRENEERMRLATEATEVGIWEWNVLTNALRWDAQMFRLYGVAPNADGSVSYETWSRAVLPEDLARQEELLMDTMRRCGKSTREFRILRADNGECRHIQAVETVRANEEGKAEWVIGTNLDVTAQKNAERAIREEAQRKDEFLAMLGHELRNPLNAIRHAVQISGETPDDADACQWAGNVIDRQSQQLSRMVDDLLDVARINRGRIDLRVEALDLGSVLEQAIAVVRPLLAQRRQTFTSDIGRPLRVTGDAARLEQVLVNLLTNAAKYTPQNGSISLRAQKEDGEVVVTITDNGVGISAQLLPHVFDLFRQADSTLDRALGGLGIGLSVVKSLIEMHLGRVTIDSAGANAGTTVTVRLPLLIEMPAAERPPAPRPLDAAPSPILRVLIVDDHQDAAQALAHLLRRRGCEVALAHTGPDGVAAAREFHPEVLLIDLGLPGFDGYEVARLLRAEAPSSSALFVAISGYAQAGDRQRCLAAGFDHHFAKPLDFPRLIEAIRAQADRRAAATDSSLADPQATAAGPAARHTNC